MNGNRLKSATCVKGEILESPSSRGATAPPTSGGRIGCYGGSEGSEESEESVGPANHDSFILIHNLGRGGESGREESDGMGS